MGEGSYFNFDLIIERVGEKYRARVFDSPAGQASAEFDIPFSELELENFVLRMGRPRAGVTARGLVRNGSGQAMRRTALPGGLHR